MMYKLILFLGIAVATAVSDLANMYNAAKFDKIQPSAEHAEKIAKEANITTKEEKHYLNELANDYFLQSTVAIYYLNKALYRDMGDAVQKELCDLTKLLRTSSCLLSNSINEHDAADLKTKLTQSIEVGKNSLKVLSHIASELDKMPDGKVAEYNIDHARKSLQRGFYSIISRHTFYGKNAQQIEEHIKTTGAKAVTEINQITGDAKRVGHVLSGPITNVVNFIDKVVQKLDEFLRTDETLSNAEAVRALYQKMMKLYGELVQFEISYHDMDDSAKLKEELNKLTEKIVVLFKEMAGLVTDTAGKQLVHEALPQTETGVQFLFYYLELAK